jgi:hypothetical protein
MKRGEKKKMIDQTRQNERKLRLGCLVSSMRGISWNDSLVIKIAETP